jgi:hypothetical protein
MFSGRAPLVLTHRSLPQPCEWCFVPVVSTKVELTRADHDPGQMTDDVPPVTGIEVRLEGVELTILDDTAGDMLSVLRRYPDGLIGFRENGRSGPVCSVFRARDAAPLPSLCVSVDDGFTVELLEADLKWPEVARVMARHGLDPARYQALALFPPSFRSLLEANIRQEAKRRSRKSVGQVYIRFLRKAVAGVVIEKL